MSFTDDYTRWMTIDCISQKLEVLAKYKEYKAWMRNQYGKPIKVLQSNQGGVRVLVYVSFPFVRSDYVISARVGFRVAYGVVASP